MLLVLERTISMKRFFHLNETVLLSNQKHMFKQMGKKIITISRLKTCLSGPMNFTLSGLQIRVGIGKLFSLFLNQNIRCGYSKELSQ